MKPFTLICCFSLQFIWLLLYPGNNDLSSRKLNIAVITQILMHENNGLISPKLLRKFLLIGLNYFSCLLWQLCSGLSAACCPESGAWRPLCIMRQKDGLRGVIHKSSLLWGQDASAWPGRRRKCVSSFSSLLSCVGMVSFCPTRFLSQSQ